MTTGRDRSALEDNLKRLATRHIDRAFQRVGKDGPLDLRPLFDIVERVHPESRTGEPAQKIAAIKATILHACETSKRLDQPIYPGHEKTHRYVALGMYDLRVIDPALAAKNYKSKRYATLISVLKDELGLKNSEHFYRITSTTRLLLAEALLDLTKGADRSEIPSPRSPTLSHPIDEGPTATGNATTVPGESQTTAQSHNESSTPTADDPQTPAPDEQPEQPYRFLGISEEAAERTLRAVFLPRRYRHLNDSQVGRTGWRAITARMAAILLAFLVLYNIGMLVSAPLRQWLFAVALQWFLDEMQRQIDHGVMWVFAGGLLIGLIGVAVFFALSRGVFRGSED